MRLLAQVRQATALGVSGFLVTLSSCFFKLTLEVTLFISNPLKLPFQGLRLPDVARRALIKVKDSADTSFPPVLALLSFESCSVSALYLAGIPVEI